MEKNRETAQKILDRKPLATVDSDIIPVKGGKIIDTAVEWIEANPQTPAQTIIGTVEIDAIGIRHDFGRTRYSNKLATLPAVKTVLENGAYLEKLPDLAGTTATNHYFAAPVAIDGTDTYLFVRVKEKDTKFFYAHEVFSPEEIEKAKPLDTVLSEIRHQMQTVHRNKQDSIKWSDLYRSIIKHFKEGKPSDITPLSATSSEMSRPLGKQGLTAVRENAALPHLPTRISTMTQI
ncbi:MAG: hypothetical protein LBT00_10920 [Spirochaetaceae bacterium]|jgi:hypothetical protein|nr:hypothetical protein [Spirochaetaceae bacterium]